MNPVLRVPVLRLDLFKIIVKMNLPLSILCWKDNLKATKILDSWTIIMHALKELVFQYKLKPNNNDDVRLA